MTKEQHESFIRPFTFRYEPKAKRAIIVEACGGRFAKFKKGERVFAIRRGRGCRHYTIERERWRGAMVPLSHQCYGIPAKCLQFI